MRDGKVKDAHTYEIHTPYTHPAKYADSFGPFSSDLDRKDFLRFFRRDLEDLIDGDIELLNALYDRGIRYADDTLRELFSELEALGFLENCLVIVTSDHGRLSGSVAACGMADRRSTTS